MTSFLELPRAPFGGGPSRPIVVNRERITAIEPTSYGTRVHVAGMSADGATHIIETVVPYAALENELGWARWDAATVSRWVNSLAEPVGERGA